MAKNHKSHTADWESWTEPRKTLQADDGKLLWSTTGGLGWISHTACSQWPSATKLNLPLGEVINIWGSEPAQCWSWNKIMTWTAHSPHVVLALQANSLGQWLSGFCDFLAFCFLTEWLYFLTFISIQIYCTRCLFPPHSSWCNFWNHLSLLPFLSVFETGFNQPWSNHTPYDCRPRNMHCIKPSCWSSGL